MRLYGHSCKICGKYKANEKFSGKGYAAHICRSCASKPLEMRDREMTMTRIANLPWQLSKAQADWLKKRMYDSREEISNAAKKEYTARFPYAERNQRKKSLHILHLGLCINGETYDECDNAYVGGLSFSIDKMTRKITMNDAVGTRSFCLNVKDMSRLLKWIVQHLEIFWWNDDYYLNVDDRVLEDKFLEYSDSNEHFDDNAILFEHLNADIEQCIHDPTIKWNAKIEYSDGTIQNIASQSFIPDPLEELIIELLSYFDPDEKLDEKM